ncbi:MAG: hypothetical protein ACK41T_09400 [Pseudobdellovibrio sp.]
MIKMMYNQIFNTLKSCSIYKNQHESFVTFDFYRDQRRASLMRLCFSPLSSWIVFAALSLFFIPMLRYGFSLSQLLGLENVVVNALYGGSLEWFLVMALIFFVTAFLFRAEFLILIFIGIFISRGDLHLIVALGFVCSVFLARPFLNLKLSFKVQSEIRKILWQISGLEIISIIISTGISYSLYDYFRYNGYYSQSMFANRYETFILWLAVFYAVELLVTSLWGHFYYQFKREPSRISLRYSTALILKKLSLSERFKAQVLTDINVKLDKLPSYQQKDLDLLPKQLVEYSQLEESFLKTAVSDLT